MFILFLSAILFGVGRAQDEGQSIPVFAGSPDAVGVNATQFLSVWWRPTAPSAGADSLTLTFRYTGGFPGWFGFGPSPAHGMLETDAWLVRILRGPLQPVSDTPAASVTDLRISIKTAVLGATDTSQDVTLLSATWYNARSDPSSAALCTPTSPLYQLYDCANPVLYVVLQRRIATVDVNDTAFNTTEPSYVAFAHSYKTSYGPYGLGYHGTPNRTLTSVNFFASGTASATTSPTASGTPSSSASSSQSASPAASHSASTTSSVAASETDIASRLDQSAQNLSTPVFAGSPDAVGVNATQFLSVWWRPTAPSAGADSLTLTFRYTGGFPGWFGFGPSPAHGMLETDAWLVRILRGPLQPVSDTPAASVTDLRISIKTAVLGATDTSQDVTLLSATWYNARSDPSSAALCTPTSPLYQLYDCANPVLYVVLQRRIATVDVNDTAFNTTEPSYVAFAHSYKTSYGPYGLGYHGTPNRTLTSVNFFASGTASATTSPTASGTPSSSASSSQSASPAASLSVTSSVAASAGITPSTDQAALNLSTPVFAGTPNAIGYNATQFLSMWWRPAVSVAPSDLITLTFRYTGGFPGWFGFGLSPAHGMLQTDAWLVRILRGPLLPVSDTPIANVTDLRICVKTSALSPMDTSQDVTLLSAMWYNATSDPAADALCAVTSPLYQLYDCANPVLYVVLQRRLATLDVNDTAFNTTETNYVAFAHSYKTSSGQYGLGYHGLPNRTYTFVSFFASITGSPTTSPTASGTPSSSISISQSTSLSGSVAATLSGTSTATALTLFFLSPTSSAAASASQAPLASGTATPASTSFEASMHSTSVSASSTATHSASGYATAAPIASGTSSSTDSSQISSQSTYATPSASAQVPGTSSVLLAVGVSCTSDSYLAVATSLTHRGPGLALRQALAVAAFGNTSAVGGGRNASALYSNVLLTEICDASTGFVLSRLKVDDDANAGFVIGSVAQGGQRRLQLQVLNGDIMAPRYLVQTSSALSVGAIVVVPQFDATSNVTASDVKAALTEVYNSSSLALAALMTPVLVAVATDASVPIASLSILGNASSIADASTLCSPSSVLSAGSCRRNFTAPDSPITLEWSPLAATASNITITFRFNAATGWFAFGIRSDAASGMIGSDIWYFSRSAAIAHITDMKATAYGPPAADAHQHVTLLSSGAPSDGSVGVEFTVTRALATGDADDNDFAIGTATPVVFAWDTTSDVIGYHGANRLTAEIDFSASDGACVIPTDEGLVCSIVTISTGTSPSASPPSVPSLTPSDTSSASATPAAAVPADSTRQIIVNSVLSFRWQVPQSMDSSITLIFDYRNPGGWLGFGIRQDAGMTHSDVWLMRLRNGVGELIDGYAAGKAMPSRDSSQDLELLNATSDGTVATFTVRRALTTGDSVYDVSFAPAGSATPVIFAWGSSSTYGYHGGNRMISSVVFQPAAGSTEGALLEDAGAALYSRITQYGFHSAAMGLIWGIVIPSAILAQRYYPFSKPAVHFHRWSATAAASLTLPAVGQAMIVTESANASGGALAHLQIGLAVTICMLLQIAMGVLTQFWKRSRKHPPQPYYSWLRKFHKFVGYLEVLCALANCFLGVHLLFAPFYDHLP